MKLVIWRVGKREREAYDGEGGKLQVTDVRTCLLLEDVMDRLIQFQGHRPKRLVEVVGHADH